MRKVRSAFIVLINIFRNVLAAWKLPPFPTLILDGVTYRAATRADMPKIYECYVAEHGKLPSIWARVALNLFPGRLIFVVTKPTDDGQGIIFLGYIMFYFAERDLKENTIHDAFHYVAPEARGMGLGYTMKVYDAQHFDGTYLSGVSAKVSVSNIGVNKMIEKIAGHTYVENFFDEDMGEERSYVTFVNVPEAYQAMLAAAETVEHRP